MAERRRWTVLAVGTFAQAATCSFLYGIPMLVPSLRSRDGFSLVECGLLVSAPIVGLLATLIVWGAIADQRGERVVICVGVAAAGVVLACAPVSGPALPAVLIIAGAAAGSVNAASGRLVMGWFPARERGLAMGVRQTAQPIGVGLAALGLPGLAAAFSPRLALEFPAALCVVAAVGVWTLAADPSRASSPSGAARVTSPYRTSTVLARIHLSSALLVVPQFAVATFTLTYLVAQRQWDAAVAGRWVFAFSVAGALGRVVSGIWSDRVGSRLRPMRQLAIASAGLMLLIAAGAQWHAVWIVVGFALGAVVTVADNGLGYTAVAEHAGSAWAGRALGVQNTAQNLAAIATAPVLSFVIGESRWSLAFAIAAVAPLVAIGTTPVGSERRLGAMARTFQSADRASG